MKTITNYWRFAPVLLLLCLSLGCTSEALNLKEFRKADGRTVVVDKKYEIPREDVVGATILLHAGVYHLEFRYDSPENIWFNSALSTRYSLVLNYTEYKKVLDNNVFRDATPDDIAKAERQKEEGSKQTNASCLSVYDSDCTEQAHTSRSGDNGGFVTHYYGPDTYYGCMRSKGYTCTKKQSSGWCECWVMGL